MEVLAGILRLTKDQVDSKLSLVEIGMYSLMAMEMHLAINDQFGVNLPVMSLADVPTVRQLAERIFQQGREQTGDVAETVAPQELQDTDSLREISAQRH